MFTDLLFIVLFLFAAFVMFDWGRIWLYARKNGFIKIVGIKAVGLVLDKTTHDYLWRREYVGYRLWTYFIHALAWVTALVFLYAAGFLTYFHLF